MTTFINKSVLGVALMVSAFAAQATDVVTISFSPLLSNQVFDSAPTGSFSGVDLNSDGVLKLNELTSFSWDLTSFLDPTLANLDGFGDFDLATNTWTPNAISWVGATDQAWFTWNSRVYSVRDGIFTMRINNNAVPEPTPVALIGVALLGLFATRRQEKKNS